MTLTSDPVSTRKCIPVSSEMEVSNACHCYSIRPAQLHGSFDSRDYRRAVRRATLSRVAVPLRIRRSALIAETVCVATFITLSAKSASLSVVIGVSVEASTILTLAGNLWRNNSRRKELVSAVPTLSPRSCYILWRSCYILWRSCYILWRSCYILWRSCYILWRSCYILWRSCYILWRSCYILWRSCYILWRSCYILWRSCVGLASPSSSITNQLFIKFDECCIYS